MARIELATSPLPRECSATELHGQALLLLENTLQYILFQSCSGAGEGNRTLVVSLEGFCSAIELHPHLALRDPQYPSRLIASAIFTLQPQPSVLTWWRGKDSNLRRQSRQIYSLIPLTTREPLQIKPSIMST